jgi:crotonobetainyl-CoA:carnitine CoA-transferase CaiB-like acyl-CoA transferase
VTSIADNTLRHAAHAPLRGIRVLDLSRVLAGPSATMWLGDLGAHVLKVERPGDGDETRGWGPPFADDGQSAYFRSVNRNKLSVALDLRTAPDRALLDRLVRDADVVLDNFLPGVLERLGVDPAAHLARHDRLIWCTITGFGAGSDRPGYDFVVQAESGWMAITGPVDGAPHKIGVALADVLCGKDAAIAILAALVARGPVERHLTVSLLDSALAGLVNVAQNVLVSGLEARRWGNAHPNLVPYQLFDAADGPLVVAVGADAQWSRMARAMGLDALADDARFATNAGRVRHRDELVSRLAARFREASAAHWVQALGAVGVPVGQVRTVAEALAGGAGSPLTGLPSPVGGRAWRPPPALDEHGALVRAEGWGAFDRLAG